MARRGGSAEAARRPSSSASSASSSSDDEFENFLSKMKTPKPASCCIPRTQSRLDDSKDDFFRYLTSKYGSGKKGKYKKRLGNVFCCLAGPRSAQVQEVPGKEAAPSASFLPPLVFSETDSDEDSVFAEGSPGNPQQPRRARQTPKWTSRSLPRPVARRGSPDSPLSKGERSGAPEPSGGTARSQEPRASAMLGSDTSDEEMDSLLERLKQKMVLSARKAAAADPKGIAERRNVPPPLGSTRPAVKSESALPTRPRSPLPARPISAQAPKSKVLGDITPSHQTQTRSSCQVQGCFLQELSDPESQHAKHFRRRKGELAQTLYEFYNRSVFEQKLPEKMEIVWNKKMRKTAGCCVSGQMKGPEGQRYARIMLSEKVCDSADRLRDTLIHELCHAAAWLIHGVRDGHGRFWRLYAKKSALVHPELPVVSRCHNYEIKYKFTYECCRCKNTIGRHSKSLDTQRFVCALCKGQFVLCQPMRKNGTPAEAPLTPFAKFVKENYSSARHSQKGLSHGDVMKKLSADFAAQVSLAPQATLPH
ncbi:germ cell nuclear acidic protein-like [Zootoca vivipara]|uniref:germ cell nuclear acidic protein-like n=1 Tax=Zootoca vivipara TaxID=8524 RepID=UPI00293BB30A|nr:germ cell nuclear acidic protein-like [Zootoca vivipara]